MQPSDIIKSSIVYIEQNLKINITAEELADMAGYSVRHYRHLFSKITGMPITAFIRKCRLDRALSEIAGGRSAVDAALEYGFDTYAGFYKAFVRVYGSSPKKTLSKTEVSIMYSENELRDILKNWDIPQNLPIIDIYIMDGIKVAGNVWSIGEDYILKTINHTGDREAFFKNLKVTKALAAQGFSSAIPLQTKSGAEYTDSKKIFTLIRSIKGQPLSKKDRFGDKRREFGIKYGESIARLHKALAAIESDIAPQEQNLYKNVTGWALPETKKQNHQYHLGLQDSFFEEYINHFGILFDKLPKQLIHRDPNPSNILFCGGEVSGFIDFDLSERNIRLFDVCYCATGILSEWHDTDDIYEKWSGILSGILQGYDNITPLTAEEKQAVFYVICSIQMIFVGYCEQQSELKELAKNNREMLQFIVSRKDQIKNIF